MPIVSGGITVKLGGLLNFYKVLKMRALTEKFLVFQLSSAGLRFVGMYSPMPSTNKVPN